ncbi:MAG: thioredoxin family protein [Spirochaetales bacterium]|nr:thioredoxin family protein [Spirochaetales bacterium]
MKIEVLGMGCPKCGILAERTGEALADAGLSVPVEKVQDLEKIMVYGVMVTPALVIDGTVKAAGRVPSKAEIIKWIGEAQS